MAYKVLIIDDTPVIREFLNEVLTDSGFDVDIAENGLVALDMVQDNDYVIIFCDVHMPVLNGLETVKKIKQLNAEVPIIMTDSFPGKLAEQATVAGAIGCLSKPFSLDELRDTINRIVNQSKPVIKK